MTAAREVVGMKICLWSSAGKGWTVHWETSGQSCIESNQLRWLGPIAKDASLRVVFQICPSERRPPGTEDTLESSYLLAHLDDPGGAGRSGYSHDNIRDWNTKTTLTHYSLNVYKL